MSRVVFADPSDDQPFSLDWTDVLAEFSGSPTISTSTWAVSPSGPTLDNDNISSAKTTTWFAGGTAGTDYTLTNTITLSDGLTTLERSLTVKVKQL